MKENIINVGIYPPPFGGVSNHLKRLHEYLLSRNYNTQLLDTSGIQKNAPMVKNINRKLVLFFLFFTPKSIVHFHGFDLKTLFLIFLVSFRHKIILSPHNEWFYDQMKTRGRFIFAIAAFMMNRLNILIVPNKNSKMLAEKFMRNKIKISLLPAFIPPINIPDLENIAIKEIRTKFKFLISTNAFKIDFYQGVDVYGLDLYTEMMNILCNNYNINVALIFLLPNIGDKDYFEKIKAKIKEYKIEDRFIFITTPLKESSSLWNISDIILRATSTDGNSLTILEGLSIGIPVIASDCVERPEGTITFKNRDSMDLAVKVKETLDNLSESRKKVENLKIQNSAIEIVKMYDKLQLEK